VKDKSDPVHLHWLDGRGMGESPGASWGVPWPRGELGADSVFSLAAADGTPVPLQSWPLAYWPDGSLKWSGHAIAGGADSPAYTLEPGTPAAPGTPVTVKETAGGVSVDTGVIRCGIAGKGNAVVTSIAREDGKEIARDLALVCLCQDAPDLDASGSLTMEEYRGEVSSVTVEQRGPVRAVVKIEGMHRGAYGRGWLPFVLRLYFHAGSEAVRLMHTFIFDGDENADFIRGIGLSVGVPMRDLLHDRHVRFCGEENGIWAEGVRNLTGLRRDPGREAIEAQLEGRACPPAAGFLGGVGGKLDLVPAFGDFTLFQSSAGSFQIRKRTKPGYAWVDAAAGARAAGAGYVGGASGGLAFGIRDFWKRHPSQLDVRGAAGGETRVNLWLWAPDAPAMDMRFYHDGLGMDTHEKQLEGMEITYEDYEPGFATPKGIARTSELYLWALPETPSRARMTEIAEAVREPAVMVCAPAYYTGVGPFGGMWSLPDRSTPRKARIEDGLDWLVDYYRAQIELHSWYGFWNHGDVMHTYDADRHVWRYDVGGFAWDNSELSTDLWLWYGFLRSGRADVFRMAEAMTRHTGEVDVYHLGRFRGLGTRHNVKHWGCSAKQARISSAVYRRIYYYLTADERTGDLMRELVDSDSRLTEIMPLRKYAHLWPPDWTAGYPAVVSIGTDWCSFAAAWLVEWERTGAVEWRDKLAAGMRSIGAMPMGWFSDGPIGYDQKTGMLSARHNCPAAVSHLSAVFGAVELCAELVQLMDAPAFTRAWLSYCELYSAGPEEQERALGARLSGNMLTVAHSRLTAYAARSKGDAGLAARAWREFLQGDRRQGWYPVEIGGKTVRIEGPAVLSPVEEARWVSTNGAAQWALAAIQNLSLIGEYLPEPDPP
jgi:hypothetical protein